MKRFLIWCSGSSPEILNQCPESERIRHSGYGGLVLIPAVLAMPSMSYAVSTITSNKYQYAGIGILWGIIVFWIDRFMVSTLLKSDSIGKDISSFKFLTRLIFAIFVGIVVAHPLVLRIFEPQINEELKRMEENKIKVQYSEKIEGIDREKADKIVEIKELENKRDIQMKRVEDEVAGIGEGTSGIYGKGLVAEAKRENLMTRRAPRKR